MKAETICDAINFLDDDLICAADSGKKTTTRKIRRMRWASVAACLCFAAAAGGIWLHFGSQPNEPANQFACDWPVKRISRPATNTAGGEVALVPHWDEMTIAQQFSSVNYQNNTYTVHGNRLSADQLDSSLGNVVLSGLDEYTQEEHHTSGSVYKITGIAETCAIAVQYEGQSDSYPCVNGSYRPDTLGELIENLNLRENLRFGSIWYENNVEFTGADSSQIWSLLLSEPSAQNMADYDFQYREIGQSLMSISVDIPLLGYRNIALSVTENGYLFTNILDTGKAFYIGIDRVDAFMDYVFENCQGYRIVYEDPIDEDDGYILE